MITTTDINEARIHITQDERDVMQDFTTMAQRWLHVFKHIQPIPLEEQFTLTVRTLLTHANGHKHATEIFPLAAPMHVASMMLMPMYTHVMRGDIKAYEHYFDGYRLDYKYRSKYGNYIRIEQRDDTIAKAYVETLVHHPKPH